MLTLIAWRNVWRNKLRSALVIFSISLGIFSGTFMMSFSWGMYERHISDAIKSQTSHIQLHHPDFKTENEAKYVIPNGHEIAAQITANARVKALSERVIAGGMASSAAGAGGVTIFGINTEQENAVTGLKTNLVEGSYFDAGVKNPVLIGEKLAIKLKVKLKSKIVLTFQNTGGDITAGAFRITGIYKTINAQMEEGLLYVKAEDLGHLLGLENPVHEIAVLLKNNDDVDMVKTQLKAENPSLLVESWKEIAPELLWVIDSFRQIMLVFIGVILIALAFGIINTMLMAVLERTKEIGMLMAIGLNKSKIFRMVVLETSFMAIIGVPLGILISRLFINYFGKAGIDISFYGKALADYGFANIVYTSLDNQSFYQVAVLALLVTLLSSLYPAMKALKLNPSESIRKI